MEITSPVGRDVIESSNATQVFNLNNSADSIIEEDRDFRLQWSALERLPTFQRIRTSFFDVSQGSGSNNSESGNERMVDVTKLRDEERRLFIEKLIKHIENDNHQLLLKLRERLDRVNVKLPTVEVRYKNLNVEAECEVVEGKQLPTLWHSLVSFFSGLNQMMSCKSQQTKVSIVKDVSGIIKPSSLTLLLGPPGSGKTTLLQALAGKANQSLKVSGEISYNGYLLDEFVPQTTSAYVSQYDLHIPEMTVRETIDFSARCQGVGSRAEIIGEVCRIEKERGIIPDPDIDTYMKAISVNGQTRSLQTDYILKILGLDICADVIVGNALKRGISGGQKKRLTTGEMIVGPKNIFFMDEISTGLDSSTTFQIVACLQQLVHITGATALVSLLQPQPETFDLFDDLILMAEGKVVYHGPCSEALKFFEECGFKCPERKAVADFLQEVISKKDQWQYWHRTDIPYSYFSVDQFLNIFATSYWGQKLQAEVSLPYDKSQSHKNALSFSKYSLSKWELFKACMARELLLMKRNSFLYVFKTAQVVFTGSISMTVFVGNHKDVNYARASFLMGCLYYTLIRFFTSGTPELSLTITRLPVVYKQKDSYLYPAWAYSIPASILKIPLSITDALIWTTITYYVIGYSPELERFFRQFLLLFALHLTSTSMHRFVASVFQNVVIATTVNSSMMLVMFLFGGFIVPRHTLPLWLRWGFWLSPMTYGEIGLTSIEFLAPQWQRVEQGNVTMGTDILRRHGLDFSGDFYWISIAALFGFTVFFNLAFILALTYLNPQKMSRATVSKKGFSQLQGDNYKNVALENQLTTIQINQSSTGKGNTDKMALPFEPLTMVFKDVQYIVDSSLETNQKKLQLLHNITGAFRPGVLTALMGVSGAGKTTLMDVLSGRKTVGTIKGDIKIGGYPKVQKTFARISGYCEQNDIHSPYCTVEESIEFSAWMRLPPEIDTVTKMKFVGEVIEAIELNHIKDALVGIPGKSGLSTEQRKRLTIAVELVSNPSIIFLDEPTSGLDARAAAVVMRTVRNIVFTGRTTVCTIHQPSIDVFETFDELILMKRGGRIIYTGMLGLHSSKLIEYFESIPVVPKIKHNYNPATWLMEVTSSSVEADLGIDYADIYKDSPLYRDTLELVRELSDPKPGSKDLDFPTSFPRNGWAQLIACLRKQGLSYWRSPEYNSARFVFITVASVMFGLVFWQKGKEINNEQDLFHALGMMHIAFLFLGIKNLTSILPYITTERSVLYREKFAGMYSAKAYAFAQVAIEVPCTLLQAVIYVIITYPAIGYEWSVYKVLWYFYSTFCTFLYFVYLGMLIASMSPNLEVASIVSVPVFTLMNLFSGFLMPGPKIPKWWVWCFWICPTSWSLDGFLTSQYGDMNKDILIFGERRTVSAFLKDYFGFRHDRLNIVAAVLIAFPIAFASLFAYCIGKLNFQKR